MDNNISIIIKNIRKKHSLTQKELADMLNVTYQAVSKWENNKSIPDIEILKLISSKFDVDMDKLLNSNTKKRKKSLVIVISLIVLIISMFMYFVFHSDNYVFEKIESLNEDFKISGIVAFSKSQNSVYISNIKYIKEDGEEFKDISCSLYEETNNTQKKVDECTSKPVLNQYDTLSNLLEQINFKIDHYTTINKKFDEKNLFIEIKALNKEGKTTSFKINLSKEKK